MLQIVLTTKVRLGYLTYDEVAEPFMEVANAKIAEIAKKYNKKPYRVSWSGILR